MSLASEFSRLAEEGEKLREAGNYAELAGRYREWSLRAVNSLIEIFGRDSELTRDFINDKTIAEEIISSLAKRGSAMPGFLSVLSGDVKRLKTLLERQAGILRAAERAADSEALKLKARLKRRVLSDLLRSARRLLENHMKDPAAILGNEVLLEVLRQRCDAIGIEYSPSDDAKTLLALLRENGEEYPDYERLAAIGEAAQEGHFFTYTKGDVEKMLEELKGIV